VKISGMIDESMDKEQMKQPPQPWEFRSKNVWQRLLIMVGGVLVNFILAFFIYAMILFVYGDKYVPVKNAVYGFDFCETALKNGFQNGDRIISVDGVEHEKLFDLVNHLALDNARRVTIERSGQILDITLPSDFTAQYLASNEKGFFAEIRFPWVISRTVAGSPAEKAGLINGDLMIAVNETETPTIHSFVQEIKGNAGKDIFLTLIRNGAEHIINLRVTDEGTIGVGHQTREDVLQAHRMEYGFFASFPAGLKYGVNFLANYVKNLKLIFTKEGVKQVGGFITIGSIFEPVWDWGAFWYMTAFLSLILAFMNILPIPALDGGHVLFILYEIITGRKPSDKFLENAQIVGMVILLGLLVLANGNDIIRLFSK